MLPRQDLPPDLLAALLEAGMSLHSSRTAPAVTPPTWAPLSRMRLLRHLGSLDLPNCKICQAQARKYESRSVSGRPPKVRCVEPLRDGLQVFDLDL